MKEVSVSDALSPVRRGMFRGWWKECYLIFFYTFIIGFQWRLRFSSVIDDSETKFYFVNPLVSIQRYS